MLSGPFCLHLFPGGCPQVFPGGAALTGATGDGHPDKALARNPGGFLMAGDIPPVALR
ncbi:TPA: hypothetical protein U2R14_004308 [Raoultella planticola]|nr:hypothetical protein [Raoultella planticola]